MITTIPWSDLIEHDTVLDNRRKRKAKTHNAEPVKRADPEERLAPRDCCCLIHQKKGHISEPGSARDLGVPKR